MSNFTLLYPSLFLAKIADPLSNLRAFRSLSEIRSQTAEKIRKALSELPEGKSSSTEKPAERWYWAAPLLLDRVDPGNAEIVGAWFADPFTWTENDFSGSNEEETGGAKQDHLEFLKECFDNPGKIQLGRMPEDLPEVLADLALGSPAVLTLRTLTRLFPDDATETQLLRSFKVGEQFASLFNKPESIAAVRLSEVHSQYWRMVADYCASGCLQAVLDEYFHLLAGQTAASEDATEQLLKAVNLTAATINVDGLDSFIKHTPPRKMRCHYAVEFGSQKIDSDQGQKRASSIRELFNSPFRPFVLATTSIGQEGLDFHFYCRRIVHWNLPNNPVDIEQREGRINRFKGLVIRQQIAQKFGEELRIKSLTEHIDPWQMLFEIADEEDRKKSGKCELVPYWHIEGVDDFKIERVIPLYPFSIERRRLARILRALAIYRLAFGQPRQAELVEQLIGRNFTSQQLETIREKLLINLSPITYGQ